MKIQIEESLLFVIRKLLKDGHANEALVVLDASVNGRKPRKTVERVGKYPKEELELVKERFLELVKKGAKVRKAILAVSKDARIPEGTVYNITKQVRDEMEKKIAKVIKENG